MCFEAIKLLRRIEMQTISVTHTAVAILHDPQPGLCSQLQLLVRSEVPWDAYKSLLLYTELSTNTEKGILGHNNLQNILIIVSCYFLHHLFHTNTL